MGKLEAIEDALLAREDVIIINPGKGLLFEEAPHGSPCLEDGKLLCCRDAIFRVAPNKGIYSEEKLTEFMDGLVPPGLKPDERKPFSRLWDRKVELGSLAFYEKMLEKDFPLGYCQESLGEYDSMLSTELRRYVRIHPYPDERMARDILEGRLNEGDITVSLLKRYKKGL